MNIVSIIIKKETNKTKTRTKATATTPEQQKQHKHNNNRNLTTFDSASGVVNVTAVVRNVFLWDLNSETVY